MKEGSTFIALECVFLGIDAIFTTLCYFQFKKAQTEFNIVS